MKNNNNEWDDNIVNQIFIPYEAHQIFNIPILDKSRDDTITWDGTPDRNYLVKNGYQTIMDWGNNANRDSTSTSDTSNDIRETLWQYNVSLSTTP
jgi:hypothetical protein